MANPQTIWDWVKGWASRNAEHYVFTRIPAERTDLRATELVPLEPYASYFRI